MSGPFSAEVILFVVCPVLYDILVSPRLSWLVASGWVDGPGSVGAWRELALSLPSNMIASHLKLRWAPTSLLTTVRSRSEIVIRALRSNERVFLEQTIKLIKI